MFIKEVKAKSIITKSNLPETDFVINPYMGCVHSCIYCYARFMKRFTGHEEKWGHFIDVKINSPDLIPENTKKYEGKRIFISSVTDAYNPLEKKYRLTRKVLEKLIPLNPELGILTKSDLVLRDVDLLKQFKSCEVGLTITSLDDKIRKEIEPFTSSPEKRIEALKRLKQEGISAYVFIGPILPFITDWKEIIEKTKQFTDFYMFENLNVRGSIWNSIKEWLKEKHPDLQEKYRQIYFSKSDYWDSVEKEIESYCREQNIDGRVYFHH